MKRQFEFIKSTADNSDREPSSKKRPVTDEGDCMPLHETDSENDESEMETTTSSYESTSFFILCMYVFYGPQNLKHNGQSGI